MTRLTMRLSGAFCLATALGACTGQIGADNQRGEPVGASSTSGPAPLDNGNGIDTDGDGVVDTVPIDLNGDGIVDGYDTNGDGIIDQDAVDTDGDGMADSPVTPTPTVPPTDVGTVNIHRLNNAEYNNTVRDLLGTTRTPSDEFPPDNSGAGFDNIASVLSLSAPHLVALQAAAELLASEALTDASQRARIVSCDLATEGAVCAKNSLLTFAQRAWHRPVTEAELANYYATIDSEIAAGDSAEQALGTVLQAALLSPHFLFRVELDADPTSMTPRALNGYEVASRLSYFLWSSMPDDTLFSDAAAGALTSPDTLTREVTRMLQNQKSEALVENFAGQWLYLRKVDEVQPDSELFPGFDASLRSAMKRETELLFTDIVFNGAPFDQLLTADYTYVDSRLAQHYGLPPPGGNGFARVDLTGNLERPGGILSHGSVLTVTSHAARTSPVLRGKWVLQQLLCTDIDPPPPDVNTTLDADANTVTASTLREQLEQHRSNAVCASCHNLMDPIGLGLENFDAIGAYRTTDAGQPIDATGTLNGSAFSGAADLRGLIAAQGDAVARCVVKNLYTYAMGRPPSTAADHYDVSTLTALRDDLVASQSLTEVVQGIVKSTPFLQRRGTEAVQ